MSMYYLAFKQMPDRVPLKQIVDINVNCFIKKKQLVWTTLILFRTCKQTI